jgi:hypothetical protein
VEIQHRRRNTHPKRVKTRRICRYWRYLTALNPLPQGESDGGGPGADMCLGKENFAGTSPAVLVIYRGAHLAINNVVNA